MLRTFIWVHLSELRSALSYIEKKHFIISELTLNSTQKRSMVCWAAIQVHYWPMKSTLNNELTIKIKTAKWIKVYYFLNAKQLWKKNYIRQKITLDLYLWTSRKRSFLMHLKLKSKSVNWLSPRYRSLRLGSPQNVSSVIDLKSGWN